MLDSDMPERKINLHFIDVTGFILPDGTGSADWLKLSLDKLNRTEQVRLNVYDGISGQLPDPPSVTGRGSCVIISGSYGTIFEDKPWIPPLLDFIRNAHDLGVHLLGICFGHHAIASALGGEVVFNPRGREMGTVPVYLTEEGWNSPLFRGFESGGLMSLLHRTHVSRMPEGAVRLAFNRMTPVQAFSVGNTFGLQFHPEITPVQLTQLAEMFKYVLIRKEKFLDSIEHYNDFITSFRDTPAGMGIIANFLDISA